MESDLEAPGRGDRIEEEVAAGGEIFVVERRSHDGWRELERTTSRASAEAALDELAGTQGIDLGDLRVRADRAIQARGEGDGRVGARRYPDRHGDLRVRLPRLRALSRPRGR